MAYLNKQDTKLLKVLLSGAFFIWGVWRMNTNQFKFYGVVVGDIQIQGYIKIACNVINPSNAKDSELLLAELIAVESNNGNAVDFSPNYGEGLTQFDRSTFDYVKKHFSQTKYYDLMQKIKTYCLVDLQNSEYEDLRKSPMLSVVMARLRFYMLPNSIPDTKLGRWEMYKKYFNSELGATTKEKYYTASFNAVIQEVV